MLKQAEKGIQKQAWAATSYSVPASVKNMFTILAGPRRLDGKQQYFSPDEVEVFYLDPSPKCQITRTEFN